MFSGIKRAYKTLVVGNVDSVVTDPYALLIQSYESRINDMKQQLEAARIEIAQLKEHLYKKSGIIKDEPSRIKPTPRPIYSYRPWPVVRRELEAHFAVKKEVS